MSPRSAVPWFTCADCGRRITEADSHVLLRDLSVTCMSHYLEHLDAGEVATVGNRSQTRDTLRFLSPDGRTLATDPSDHPAGTP